ncbi:hypothetical protein [Candidatus Thalassolituus haligoni]|uniref:hypothetical protein n=1 Tax=Candidatus Thalassolituus haligoni TaxID=3100113 RepID=UPI00351488D2
MDVSQLIPLAAQLVTLVALFLVVTPLKKRLDQIESRQKIQAAEQSEQYKLSSETLDSVVNEIKDHFEISLNNLLRDTDDINNNLKVNGEQSQRALELQELAFSEATTGNTRIQDVLSENHRRQQKLIEDLTRTSVAAFRETTAHVQGNVHQALEVHNGALLKLSESSQRMLGGMTANFSEISKEIATLKKAVAAIINFQRSFDHTIATRLEQALEPVGEQQKQHLAELHSVFERQGQQLELAETFITTLADINRSLQMQRQQLHDVSENSSTVADMTENLVRNQLEASTFERRHESLSQEVAELSVMMQPLLESIHDTHPAAAGDATVLAESLDALRLTQQQATTELHDLRQVMQLLRLQKLVSTSIANQALSTDISANGARIETADTVQYLSPCRIEQVEDKSTGESTRFKFDDSGRKLTAETFISDRLKYRMHFDVAGNPTRSSEYDELGREVFQYDYNPFGELVRKTQLHYDPTGMAAGSTETLLV